MLLAQPLADCFPCEYLGIEMSIVNRDLALRALSMAAAVLGLIVASPFVHAAEPVLLVPAGPRAIPTNNTVISGTITVSSSDPSVTTQYATEFYEPDSVFGTLITTGGNTSFVEGPSIFSTVAQPPVNNFVSSVYGDARAFTTILGGSFQAVANNNTSTLPGSTVTAVNSAIQAGSYVSSPESS